MKNSVSEQKLIFFESWVIFMGLLLLLFLIVFLNNLIFSASMIFFIVFSLKGFFLVKESESVIGVFLGKYVGTIKQPGFFWINPLISKKRIITKTQTGYIDKLVISDLDNFPFIIDIAFIWNISDTAKAYFSVDNYVNYLNHSIKTNTISYLNKTIYSTVKKESTEYEQKIKTIINNSLNNVGLEIIEFNIINISYPQDIEKIICDFNLNKNLLETKLTIIEQFSQHIQDILHDNDFFINLKGTDEEKNKTITETISMFIHLVDLKSDCLTRTEK